MAELETVEQAAVAYLETIPGMIALDHEPEDLPSLPCCTLLFRQRTQTYDGIGPKAGRDLDVTYEWTLFLYVPMSTFRTAQTELKRLQPLVQALEATQPPPDAWAGWQVDDSGEEPDFDRRKDALTKRLTLRASTFDPI